MVFQKKIINKMFGGFKLIILVFLSFIVFTSIPALAVEQTCTYNKNAVILSVPIPGMDLDYNQACGVYEFIGSVGGNLFIDYVKALYKFFVGIAGILAVFMIMYGGVQWIFSGGNATKISTAKETIFGALIGLFLALGSYTLLRTINPSLVNLSLNVPIIKTQTLVSTWCKDVVLGEEFKSKTFKIAECPSGQTCIGASDKDSTKCGVKYQIPGGGNATCLGASDCSGGTACAQKWWTKKETPICVNPANYCFWMFDQVTSQSGLSANQKACDYAMSMFAEKPSGTCKWKPISWGWEIAWDISKILVITPDNPIYEWITGNNYRGADDGCKYYP